MRAERVLVVSDEMEVGGSQRQIVHLLRGVQADRRTPRLLYFRSSSFLVDTLRAEGVPVDQIDKRGAIDPLFLFRLWRYLRRGQFDVVHCFSITAEIWVRLALLLVPHTRLISSVRGLGLEQHKAWHDRAKRWVIQGSAAVISNSRAGATWVAERTGMPLPRFAIIANACQAAERSRTDQSELRTALGLPPARAVLLFVGRLVVAKNLPLLLRALAHLPATQRPLTVLVGDGPERAALEHMLRDLALAADVELRGERADVADWMAAADMLVLPSREEGMSNVILEAMAQGLPVIATRVGGSPELIEHGVHGLLVDNDDDAQLTAAIAELHAKSDLRQRLGRAAQQRAEHEFSPAAMAAATLQVYDRCMEASPI
ncbi:glycosyltransferase [Pseudomarimonas arenosa]|uniref:Glycosyltransferase n=1 Tax=Pseudomarimonas arenosa TaxID=2774145 RepID=A0AAW3ZHX2_9GAMM|nr:glycosyltransferase [Pseudomarimonas arenosa]MBD8524844.1 glycosyltransferase [Pseudomarimonas arenosa]